MPDADPLLGQHPGDVGAGLGQRLGRDQHLGADEPRAPHRLDRHVEGKAETAEHLVGGVEREERGLGTDEVAGIAVADHHPLGPTGRAGGVDDIGEVVRRDSGVRPAEGQGGLGGEVAQRRVERQRPPGHRLDALGIGQRQDGAGIHGDEVDAVLRIAPVDRDIGGARPQRTEDRHILVEASWEAQHDPVAAVDPHRAQPMRKLERPIAKLDIGQARAPAALRIVGQHPDCARRAEPGGTLVEQLVEQFVARVRCALAQGRRGGNRGKDVEIGKVGRRRRYGSLKQH